jgi:hypothetical protein
MEVVANTVVENVAANVATEVTKGFFSNAASAVASAVGNNPIVAAVIGVAVVGAVGYGTYRYINRDKVPAMTAFDAAAAELAAVAAATK